MASKAGAPKVCSLRTIKSDVVVGLEDDEIAEKLDQTEPGWKISGKYVSPALRTLMLGVYADAMCRLSSWSRKVVPAKRSASTDSAALTCPPLGHDPDSIPVLQPLYECTNE